MHPPLGKCYWLNYYQTLLHAHLRQTTKRFAKELCGAIVPSRLSRRVEIRFAASMSLMNNVWELEMNLG